MKVPVVHPNDAGAQPQRAVALLRVDHFCQNVETRLISLGPRGVEHAAGRDRDSVAVGVRCGAAEDIAKRLRVAASYFALDSGEAPNNS